VKICRYSPHKSSNEDCTVSGTQTVGLALALVAHYSPISQLPQILQRSARISRKLDTDEEVRKKAQLQQLHQSLDFSLKVVHNRTQQQREKQKGIRIYIADHHLSHRSLAAFTKRVYTDSFIVCQQPQAKASFCTIYMTFNTRNMGQSPT